MSLSDTLEHYVLLSSLIFTIGGVGFLVRRNVLVQLMSIELMLNSVNLLLVAFDVWLSRTAEETLHSGQALTLFTIAIAAAEIGIGLAIVLAVYRNRGTSDIDRLRDSAEGHEPAGADRDGLTAEQADRTGKAGATA